MSELLVSRKKLNLYIIKAGFDMEDFEEADE